MYESFKRFAFSLVACSCKICLRASSLCTLCVCLRAIFFASSVASANVCCACAWYFSAIFSRWIEIWNALVKSDCCFLRSATVNSLTSLAFSNASAASFLSLCATKTALCVVATAFSWAFFIISFAIASAWSLILTLSANASAFAFSRICFRSFSNSGCSILYCSFALWIFANNSLSCACWISNCFPASLVNAVICANFSLFSATFGSRSFASPLTRSTIASAVALPFFDKNSLAALLLVTMVVPVAFNLAESCSSFFIVSLASPISASAFILADLYFVTVSKLSTPVLLKLSTPVLLDAGVDDSSFACLTTDSAFFAANSAFLTAASSVDGTDALTFFTTSSPTFGKPVALSSFAPPVALGCALAASSLAAFTLPLATALTFSIFSACVVNSPWRAWINFVFASSTVATCLFKFIKHAFAFFLDNVTAFSISLFSFFQNSTLCVRVSSPIAFKASTNCFVHCSVVTAPPPHLSFNAFSAANDSANRIWTASTRSALRWTSASRASLIERIVTLGLLSNSSLILSKLSCAVVNFVFAWVACLLNAATDFTTMLRASTGLFAAIKNAVFMPIFDPRTSNWWFFFCSTIPLSFNIWFFNLFSSSLIPSAFGFVSAFPTDTIISSSCFWCIVDGHFNTTGFPAVRMDAP